MNPFEKILERLDEMIHPKRMYLCKYAQSGCIHLHDAKDCRDCVIEISEKIVKEVAEESNNGWIPCSKELPPQPQENALLDNKPLELYMVCENVGVYPFRAFWNGKNFTDGFSKVDAIAWQPLPEPYQPKGE